MDTQEADGAVADPGLALFGGIQVPVCLVDGDGLLVAINPKGVAFFGISAPSVLGRPVMESLHIAPADGSTDAWGQLAIPGADPRLPCRITVAGGEVRPASVIYVALEGTTARLGVLFVIEGAMADALADLPEWALRDPVTLLGNRHFWERELGNWARRRGCVVFFDLDDLKEVNDLHGHVAGDRLLATAGQALAAVAPPDALTVRYGGDEFVVALADTDVGAAEAWARKVVADVALTATSAVPIVPRLSHGVAAFGPGTLRDAVQRAADALYEGKGVLLRASSGGRIILTREGHAALRGPGDERTEPRPGNYGTRFGVEFEGYFRAIYARSLEQAREFVTFVDPEPGGAVIEVGAGSGRITFEGGLAERIGPRGQLLVTDPSGAQMQTARRHAEERGWDFLRFLRAPAEDLPVASGTADLVLGALFLHFTDATRTLREMARVVRPGGRVALCAARAFEWPAPWEEVLAPVRRELALLGRPFRHYFLQPGELERLLVAAGLRVERLVGVGPELWELRSAELGVEVARQLGLIPLLLKDVPAERQAAVQEEFEANLRARFDQYPPSAWTIATLSDNAVARKPL